MQKITHKSKLNSNREVWVDYLRIFAVFLVIPYHIIISYVESVFGEGTHFTIWNEYFPKGAHQIWNFFNPWHMQLLFVLAGFSLVLSLKKRSFKIFTQERLIRIGIPIIFGIILLNAIMSWFSTMFYYNLHPEVNPIYPNLPDFWTFFVYWWWIGKSFNSGHLWFLVVLLVLSLGMGLIISLIQKKKADSTHNQNRSTKFLKFLTHPATMLLWGLIATPLSYIKPAYTNPTLSAIFGVFQYNQVLFFLFGIILACNRQNIDRINQHWKWTLPLGFSMLITWIIFQKDYLLVLKNVGAWFFVYGLICLASVKLTKSSKTLQYLSKASMPVYILHLPLEIIVGYFIIQLPIYPILEIFLLVIINLILCFLLYDGIHRLNRVIPGIGLVVGIKEKNMMQKIRRMLTIVKLEMKRLFREPMTVIFTLFLVPILIIILGLAMGSNYGWHPDYSIFDIMMPGLLAYNALLSTYDVAASVASEKELGIQIRINTTPLTSAEYIGSHLISYSIKPIIQLLLSLLTAYAVGYRPVASVVGYIVVIAFMIFLTLCSVGFGLITANFAKSSSSAGSLAFAFIVPQQIFASIIPPAFLGMEKLAMFMPSFYATEGMGLLLAGASLTTPDIWAKMGILGIFTLVFVIIGTILYEKGRKE
ncbi:Glucans biosynthesis protein C [Candidatus Lokiarchaeum ossiferum]|uniref:Glucans biosynthesis protein C n=1 Tax=Candidatus Lokiarchaeum ossiferum TaxID=2951803 RepID=A0ABY6HQU4_9ARCH|nr:Glucans biosynthesis protein C [Candidatus Lokiarchaeum sp. B-35]